MIRTNAVLLSIELLTPYVRKITLGLPQETPFKAGQYLTVVMGEDDKRPFSIANHYSHSVSKNGNVDDIQQTIELHIGATESNPYAFEVIQSLTTQGQLSIELPHGEAYLQQSENDAIIIAGGTGYSYAKSVLHELLETQTKRKVKLYWGAKEKNDLYELEALEKLSEQHPNFSFMPVLESPPEHWHGKLGLVHEAVVDDYDSLHDKQIYVAGHFDMARVIRDDFLPKGLAENQLIGDAYAFI